MNKLAIGFACGMAATALVSPVLAQDAKMSFFITSQGSGDGAKLGGLKGADALCQKLARAVGAGGKTWRAYLSSSAGNARDRIGKGPWYNAKGVLIAKNLAALHGNANAINKLNGLTEKAGAVNGRGDRPNMHDILTGSNAAGELVAGKTCNDWTNNGPGSAFVGHHDRKGLRDDAPSKSWNSSHPSRGCSQSALRSTGGNGFFYCFAVR